MSSGHGGNHQRTLTLSTPSDGDLEHEDNSSYSASEIPAEPHVSSQDDEYNSDESEESDAPAATPAQSERVSPLQVDENADVIVVSGAHPRSPVRQPSPTSPKRVPKRPFTPSQPSDDDNLCIICLENWTSAGPHQICCLPCGHLFGYACIRQWLGRSRRGRQCPNCKTSARIKDLRYIFGVSTRLAATDTSEIQSLQKRIRQETESHEYTKLKLKETRRIADQAIREMKELRKRVPKPVPTFGGTRGGPAKCTRHPTLLADCNTNGDTVAVAFDNNSGVLFGERMSGSVAVSQRLSRLDIGRCAIAQSSRAVGNRRVNAIAVDTRPSSPSHRSVAVADAGRKLTILAPNLNLAANVDCGSSLLSATWLERKPNCVVVGAVDGKVLTYDVRNLAGGQLSSVQLAFGGARGVHSVRECTVNDDLVLLAGTPSGLFGVRYSEGLFTAPIVSDFYCADLEGASICSVAVDAGLIAVSSRRRVDGEWKSSILLNEGLRWREDGKFTFSATVGKPLQGHSQTLPFEQVGVLGGGDGGQPMVVAADRNAKGKVRMWNTNRLGSGSQWKTFEIEQNYDSEGATVRACAAQRLPRRARLDKVPKGTEALFACVTYGSIRLFAAGS